MELKLKDNSNNPEEYWERYKRETSVDRKLGDQWQYGQLKSKHLIKHSDC